MWPYITEAVSKEAQNQLPQLIKDSKPTWMGDINLHKCVSFSLHSPTPVPYAQRSPTSACACCCEPVQQFAPAAANRNPGSTLPVLTDTRVIELCCCCSKATCYILPASRFKLGGAPPKLTDIRVVKDPGAKGLQGDDYIHLEVVGCSPLG